MSADRKTLVKEKGLGRDVSYLCGADIGPLGDDPLSSVPMLFKAGCRAGDVKHFWAQIYKLRNLSSFVLRGRGQGFAL